MAYFPCPNRSDCEPVAEGVAARNFSAEAPDVPSFFGQFQCVIDGTNPPFANCTSIVSQAQADFCASRCYPSSIFVNGLVTATGPCGAKYTAAPGMFAGTSQQSADQIALNYAQAAANKLCGFQNVSQTCNVTCADSSVSSYTVVAGSISAASQSAANSIAMQMACANAALGCFGSLIASEAQTCEIPCPANGGTISYTIPAGLVHALSLAAANAAALELACALGLLACSELPELVPSDAQTCSMECLGQSVSYTVPASAFFAVDKSSANALAFLFACLTLAQACAEEDLPPASFSAGNSVQCATIICP